MRDIITYSMKVTLVFIVCCIALAFNSVNAIDIYHSPNDDGVPAENSYALNPDGASNILHLYITVSSVSPVASPNANACSGEQTAIGTELCGWDIKIEGVDNMQLVSFTPALGVTHVLTTPNLLRVNGGQALSPMITPEKIGDLTVSANGVGELEVTGTNYVNALMELKEITSIVIANAITDADGDGIADDIDNCSAISNSDQRDTDNDGFGNFCDPDLNNDGAVNFTDLGLMRSVFFTADEDADLNGDGAVNFVDLGILRSQIFSPPGPSGVNP